MKSRSRCLGELVGRVAEDGGSPAGLQLRADKGGAVDAIAALSSDGEGGIGFLNVDRFVLPVASQLRSEPIGGVEQPGIAGLGGEQHQLTE